MRTSLLIQKEEIDKVIARCAVCFVGMNGADGIPYVIPMNFGYDGKEFILHSAREGKHVELLARDNRVSLTFCTSYELRCQHPDVACSYSMEAASVICSGTVSFIDDNDLQEKERLLGVFMRHYVMRDFTYSAPALRHVRVWKVKIGQMTGKIFGQNFKNRQAPEGMVER